MFAPIPEGEAESSVDEVYPSVPLKQCLNMHELMENEKADFEVQDMNENDEKSLERDYKPGEVYMHLRLPDMTEETLAQMEDLSGDGGVLKEVLSEGRGDLVYRGCTVVIDYNAYIFDAQEPYDSTYIRARPQKFTLVKNFENPDDGVQVITGLDLGVSTMREGEVSLFILKPYYAYGKMGVRPRIPPNATIRMEVKLQHFNDSSDLDAFYSTPASERKSLDFQVAKGAYESKRKHGRTKFENGYYRAAYNCYVQCRSIMDEAGLGNEEDELEQKRLWLVAVQNAIICCLKEEKYRLVVDIANGALGNNPKNIKILYAKGKALHHLGEHAQARAVLHQARTLEPTNTDINKELKALHMSDQRQNRRSKQVYQNMVKDLGSKVDEPTASKKKTGEEKKSSDKKKTDKKKNSNGKKDSRKTKNSRDDNKSSSEEEDEVVLGFDEQGKKLLCKTQTEFKETIEDFLQEYLAQGDATENLTLPCSTFHEGAQYYVMIRAQELGLEACRVRLLDNQFGIRIAKKTQANASFSGAK